MPPTSSSPRSSGDPVSAAAPRRVAITGVGVLASCGIGADAFWAGLLSPAPEGERRIRDFDPLDHYPNVKEARRADRFCQLAVAAADEALAGAGGVAALAADPGRIGVLLGTGVGGIATLEEQILTFHPGDNTATIFIGTNDLLVFLDGLGVKYRIIQV